MTVHISRKEKFNLEESFTKSSSDFILPNQQLFLTYKKSFIREISSKEDIYHKKKRQEYLCQSPFLIHFYSAVKHFYIQGTFL